MGATLRFLVTAIAVLAVAWLVYARFVRVPAPLGGEDTTVATPGPDAASDASSPIGTTEALQEQLAALQATLIAIQQQPTATGPVIPTAAGVDPAMAGRLNALSTQVAGMTTQVPPTIPTVIAAEGLPIDAPLHLTAARASTTDASVDANEVRIHLPDFLIDGSPSTMWNSADGDLDKPWIDLTLDGERTISGIRLLTAPHWRLPFVDATLMFSDNTARSLHLTEAQVISTGWKYFSLTPEVRAAAVRIVLNSLNTVNNCHQGSASSICLAEIELYGR